jgi:hypothetical protein
MTFPYDANGVEPSEGGYLPLPAGYYDLQIYDYEEQRSKDGDPLVVVHFEVVDHAKYNGRKVRYHNVAFLPKDKSGAGIAIHFLKTIGQPWQGKFDVSPDNWIGKRIRAEVKIREYQGKQYNAIAGVLPYEWKTPAEAANGAMAPAVEEELPF